MEGGVPPSRSSVPPKPQRKIQAMKQESEERFPAAFHFYIWGCPFIIWRDDADTGQFRFPEGCCMQAYSACPCSVKQFPLWGKRDPTTEALPTTLPGSPGAPHTGSQSSGVSPAPTCNLTNGRPKGPERGLLHLRSHNWQGAPGRLALAQASFYAITSYLIPLGTGLPHASPDTA